MIIEKIKELSKKLDYKENSFEKRKQIAEEITNDKFIIDYINDYTGVLNSNKNLSENDPVFNFLDRVSNYILNCEEVKEENKTTQYKIYADELAFTRALNKELNIEGMISNNSAESEGNIIHFLKKENKNYKKSKNQTVNKKDFNKPEISDVLKDYDNYLSNVTTELKNHTDSKLSRIQLSKISGSVKQDMIDSKNILLGVFGYNSSHSESTVVDWDQFDYRNKEHVKAMLHLKPGHRADEDLMYLVDDFNKRLKKSKLSKEQWNIIDMLRQNIKITEISRELDIDRTSVYKKINAIAGRIVKQNKDYR